MQRMQRTGSVAALAILFLSAAPGPRVAAAQEADEASPAAAVAATAAGSADEKLDGPYADGPCARDLARWCAKVPKGPRTRYECLRMFRKRDSLRPECTELMDAEAKERIERAARKRAEFYEACGADGERLCPQFMKKRTALVGCLHRKKNEENATLSKECLAKLPRRPGYKGPGYKGWKDGSEPADFDEKLEKRLHPNKAKRLEMTRKRKEAAEARKKEVQEKLRAYKQALDAKAAARGEPGGGKQPAGSAEESESPPGSP